MANILSKTVTASSLKSKIFSGILSVFYKNHRFFYKKPLTLLSKKLRFKQQNIDKLALEKEELMQVAEENEVVVSKLSKLLNTDGMD